MALLKFTVVVVAVFLAVVNAVPTPEAKPGWKHEHHHAIIQAPYHVHNVHHHHIEKVAVPVPIIKKVVVHDLHDHHHHHDLLHHHDLHHHDLHHHDLHHDLHHLDHLDLHHHGLHHLGGWL